MADEVGCGCWRRKGSHGVFCQAGIDRNHPLKAREGNVENPNGFYIREGEARVNERGEITFTPLPPRAKRPAFVTLCAYERNSDGETIYEFRRMAHP